MNERVGLVTDTNILVSRFFFRNSIAARALRLGYQRFNLLRSSETHAEFEAVLRRSTFDRYRPLEDRLRFAKLIERVSHPILHVPPVIACRDPKDDKFLALAIAGRASVILTGDRDLLELHPFRGIDIINPRQFLDRYSGAHP
jgi:putative PIN family toxin of toxin-antitoxin system